MSPKKIFAFLLLFILPLPMFFFIICTVMACRSADGLPALIVFLPVDIIFFLLLRWCIRVVRSEQKQSSTTKTELTSKQVILCWDCGGRNQSTSGKPGKCQYCGANLRKNKTNPYL